MQMETSEKIPVVDIDKENNTDPVVNNDEQNVEQKNNRLKSFVWQHFTRDKTTGKAKCPYCKYSMAATSKMNGTSSLRYHLLHVCTTSPVYKKLDKKDMKKQTVLGFKQPNGGETSGSLACHKFNQEKCRNLLARMCAKDNRPFSIVEDEGLREFVWELNPMFKFPSRWTIARDCLSLFEEERKKLKILLKDKTVSLTTDTWTSVQNYNYMCLTVHWVDDDWILRKKIINFCQISNHKGEMIGRLIYQCLKAWEIDSVFTVTVDNASSNDMAIKHLKLMLKGPNAILDCKYLHLRCNAHIINLAVKEGLEEQDQSIRKIRNAIRYLRSSPSRYQCFKECVEKERIEYKRKPCLDVETRWNSTFLMLETTLKFVKAFDRLRDVNFNYRSYFDSEVEDDDASTRNGKTKMSDRELGAPNSKDWENASLFVEHLRIFFDATKKISGTKYVTANLLFGELCQMHTSIAQMTLSPEENKKKMVVSMKKKFDKYWDNLANMNPLLYVALILDPRDKMFYLTFCLELIYGEKGKQVDVITGRVKATLVELFDSYKMKFDKPTESTSTSSSSSVVNTNGVTNIKEGYMKYLAKKRGSGVNASEVEVYLNDGCETKILGDNSFDVLDLAPEKNTSKDFFFEDEDWN
ncbi:hypothetical protein SSX86_024798 [Deinandra increscens subsp. villosa]|uniref:BED-type domain-containing protein n=1 Tax=Deinandra increscens subsp. villosa TaxID=3103831 RepID=A0AAP0CI86_9ASTR